MSSADESRHGPRPSGTDTLESRRGPHGKIVWASDELLGNDIEVLVTHGDQVYRLRCTRKGKLILSK